MKTLLGIDIGTSSTKALLMDENGTTIALKKQFYRISIPQPGWAEQNPEKPGLTAPARVLQVKRDSNAALFATYEDGSADYQILMTMTWEVM